MATNVLATVETEDLVTKEIFGEGVGDEVRNAKKTLRDFADYLPKLKTERKNIEDELDSCTRKGQAAEIMARVRRQYL